MSLDNSVSLFEESSETSVHPKFPLRLIIAIIFIFVIIVVIIFLILMNRNSNSQTANISSTNSQNTITTNTSTPGASNSNDTVTPSIMISPSIAVDNTNLDNGLKSFDTILTQLESQNSSIDNSLNDTPADLDY